MGSTENGFPSNGNQYDIDSYLRHRVDGVLQQQAMSSGTSHTHPPKRRFEFTRRHPIITGAAVVSTAGFLALNSWEPDWDGDSGTEVVIVQPEEPTVVELTQKSNIEFLEVGMDTSTAMVGIKKRCLPFTDTYCLPYSAWTIRNDVSGNMHMTARIGSISMVGQRDEQGDAYTVVSVDSDNFEAHFSPTDTELQSDNYGWAALKDLFTEDEVRNRFSGLSYIYAQDSGLQTCSVLFEDEPDVIAGALAEPVRDIINMRIGTESDPASIELMEDMGEDGSTLIFKFEDNEIDISTPPPAYPSGETITFVDENIELTLGEPQPCAVDDNAEVQIEEYRNKPGVTVEYEQSTNLRNFKND